MGAAVAREAAESRGRPASPDHVRPFPGAAEVLQIETGTQHAAVDDARRKRRELTGGSAGHRLIEKLRTVRDLLEMGLRQALERSPRAWRSASRQRHPIANSLLAVSRTAGQSPDASANRAVTNSKCP